MLGTSIVTLLEDDTGWRDKKTRTGSGDDRQDHVTQSGRWFRPAHPVDDDDDDGIEYSDQ